MYQGLYRYDLQIPLYHCLMDIMFILQMKIVRLTGKLRDLRYNNQGHMVIAGQG